MGHVKWWPLAAFVAIFVTDLSSVSAKDVGRYGKVCLSTVKIHPTMTCDLIANMCKVSLKELFERNPYFQNGAVCNGPLKLDQSVCCSYQKAQGGPQMPYVMASQNRYQQRVDEDNSLDVVFGDELSTTTAAPPGTTTPSTLTSTTPTSTVPTTTTTPTPSRCNWRCPPTWQPVCGTNRITYRNTCYLRLAMCRNPRIRFWRWGRCPWSPFGSDGDEEDSGMDSVEDFDDELGAEADDFDDEADNLDEDFEDGVLNDDQLDQLDNGAGRDEHLFWNLNPFWRPHQLGRLDRCRFRRFRRRNPGLCRGRVGLSSGSEGSRNEQFFFPPSNLRPNVHCSRTCPDVDRPVCGTDGVTYDNRCLLRRASCRDPSIRFEHSGECDEDEEENRAAGSDEGLDDEASGLNGFDEDDGGRVEQGWGRRNRRCRFKCPYDIIAPVCGSDNRTYLNNCVLKKKACRRPELGLTAKLPTECPMDYSNRTSQAGGRGSGGARHRGGWGGSRRWGWGPFSYLSPFWLTPGFIPACPAICPASFIPVCGSDGLTYYSECHLRQTACSSPFLALGVRHGGQCVVRVGMASNDGQRNSQSLAKDMTKPPVCSSQCRPEAASTQPVCGSDGQTYTNLCQLESESCKNPAKGLYMLTDAPCKADVWSACQENCSKIASPVCGSDSTTYLNDCFLRLAACRNYGKSIVKVSDGKCPGQENARGSQTLEFTTGFGLGAAVASRVTEGCFTIFGERCVFPFRYKGTLLTRCTTEEFPFPWCATRTDSLANGETMLRWNKCALGPEC